MVELGQYDYDLPHELIRREGVEPRDAARLLVYDTAADTVTYDTFRNLATYLPAGALVVLNDTRVVPARLLLRKETGGKIEVFVLMNEYEGKRQFSALTNRKTKAGERLFFPDGNFCTVVRAERNRLTLALAEDGVLEEILDLFGTTPLPHYLKSGPCDEHSMRARYQTIFATVGKSVAAPTAALHFTSDVIHSLATHNIAIATVTLDVGLGTFAPLTAEHFATQKLHPERYTISAQAAARINAAKHNHRAVVAVGTTTMRVLESAPQSGRVIPGAGVTDIFITPPYQFEIADILLTNFHLPRTSLMLLVQAFLQYKKAPQSLRALYQQAIRERMAFYSFGDAMLII